MDLGINGRWALVCGASKGLGLGCARALVREGVTFEARETSNGQWLVTFTGGF